MNFAAIKFLFYKLYFYLKAIFYYSMTSTANVETVVHEIDNNNSVITQLSSSGNFIKHLKTYPIVVTTRQEVLKVPYMDNAIDMMTTVMAPLWCEFSDKMANGALNQIDRIVPSLKTTQASDITDCVTKPVVELAAYTDAATVITKKIIQNEITQPATKVPTDVEKIYHHYLYNEEGKNRLLSPMDPMIEPVNGVIIQLVDYWKPDTLKPTSKESTSEIHRGKHILWNF